ncbi:hypothetical protein GGQ99_001286 [Aminobacter niigataensis]|uniref:HdeA/HdeB family protein n=1 Tax=Aminobacter niigataensis TaxID=83265 RepID=A0ABR6KYF4_9HYPH|nr:hypothetical protein [Aminobacter niigataensis]MBB4649564.1 hypothetical protein [Aminobacter niigataensis]
MRILFLLAVLMSSSALAESTDEAVKKTVFRLTTAFQCAPIIKDQGPYEWAKKNAAELVGSTKAAELAAHVEGQSLDGSPLNEKFCRKMLENFK